MHERCGDSACRAERNSMLARKVMNRSGRNYRIFYPSKKLNRMVHCESILERDAANLFEKSNFVLLYQEQPLLISYFDGEEIKDYFPDFLLSLENIHVFIEVKPSSKLAKPEIIKKFNAIKDHFANNKMFFLILDEHLLKAKNSLDQFERLVNSIQTKGEHKNAAI